MRLSRRESWGRMDPFRRENVSVIDCGTQRDIAGKGDWRGTNRWYSMTRSPCRYSQWRKNTRIPSRRATRSQGNTVVVLFRYRAWFLLRSMSSASGRTPNTSRPRTLRHSRPSCRICRNLALDIRTLSAPIVRGVAAQPGVWRSPALHGHVLGYIWATSSLL